MQKVLAGTRKSRSFKEPESSPIVVYLEKVKRESPCPGSRSDAVDDGAATSPRSSVAPIARPSHLDTLPRQPAAVPASG